MFSVPGMWYPPRQKLNFACKKNRQPSIRVWARCLSLAAPELRTDTRTTSTASLSQMHCTKQPLHCQPLLHTMGNISFTAIEAEENGASWAHEICIQCERQMTPHPTCRRRQTTWCYLVCWWGSRKGLICHNPEEKPTTLGLLWKRNWDGCDGVASLLLEADLVEPCETWRPRRTTLQAWPSKPMSYSSSCRVHVRFSLRECIAALSLSIFLLGGIVP